jgi:hypothetical protein
MTDLEAAWAERDAANTIGWTVERPSLHDDVRGAEHWEQWAYEAREKPKAGKRSRGVDGGRTDRGAVRSRDGALSPRDRSWPRAVVTTNGFQVVDGGRVSKRSALAITGSKQLRGGLVPCVG